MRTTGFVKWGAALCLGLYARIATADSYVECNDCNQGMRAGAAQAWRQQNMSAPATEPVHVVDMNRLETSSFLTKVNPPAPPSQGHPIATIGVTAIETPQNVQFVMNDVRSATVQFRAAVTQTPIPTSVIPNAWQMVNCAFCENRIENWVQSQAGAEKLRVQEALVALAQSFGWVHASTANIYIIPLASGGNVEVEITVTNEPITLDVSVVKVTDVDGNDVPQQAPRLNRLQIYLGAPNSASIVNSYINPLLYMVPGRTGIVTIQECPAPHPDSERPCTP